MNSSVITTDIARLRDDTEALALLLHRALRHVPTSLRQPYAEPLLGHAAAVLRIVGVGAPTNGAELAPDALIPALRALAHLGCAFQRSRNEGRLVPPYDALLMQLHTAATEQILRALDGDGEPLPPSRDTLLVTHFLRQAVDPTEDVRPQRTPATRSTARVLKEILP